MADSDPIKPTSRPSTPQSLTWFEFLLNPDLLQEHLAKENPDPSPGALIAVFLQQVETAVTVAKNLSKEGDNGEKSDSDTPVTPNPKKAQALRILALKVAAYLKWDLDVLENSLPIAMVLTVLQELLSLVSPPGVENMQHTQLDLQDMPKQMLFALILYHRWCLRTVVKDSFPERPSKSVNVQVPGLNDPTLSAGPREPVIKLATDTSADSVTILEQVLSMKQGIAMPTVQCFGTMDETTETVSHDWNKSLQVSADETACQLSYDVGSVYFLSQEYPKAKELFSTVKAKIKQVKKPVFMCLDEKRLEGYCAACGINSTEGSAYSRVKKTAEKGFKDLPDLLLKENKSSELSLQYRVSLEEELKLPENRPEQIIFKVETCNIVKRIQDTQTPPASYVRKLENAKNQDLEFLFKVCDDAMATGSYTQKTAVKEFVRFLCIKFPERPAFHKRLSEYLNHAELHALSKVLHEAEDVTKMALTSSSFSTDPAVQQAETEQQLRQAYDPSAINKLVKQIWAKGGFKTSIKWQWKVPREMMMSLDKMSNDQDRVLTQILLAKAATCIQQKLYKKGRELLESAEEALKDASRSYDMVRLIRAELLYVDLLQHQHKEVLPADTSLAELTKKVKRCVSAVMQEKEPAPRGEIVAACAGFLLSTQEWDFLANLANPGNGHLQLSRLVALLCKELPMIKTARKPARDLWEAVVLIFTISQQQKRSSSGSSSTVHRDANMGVLPQGQFTLFLKMIKEPIVLSTLISCLTKLYSILKDEITCDISSDYVILWPTVVGSASSMNLHSVGEAVSVIMEHALQYHPAQTSWLRTQADIHYAHNQYTPALKHYLEAGIVATEFFADAVPKAIFDDQVYRKMIRCCSYLHNHTQVAVLCQFLEETDYTTAFKALQERNPHDAMDAYYPCLWDSTILEYLIHLHTKRGEIDKKNYVMQLIGQLELNCSNPAEILNEAAKYRKTHFLRALSKQYL